MVLSKIYSKLGTVIIPYPPSSRLCDAAHKYASGSGWCSKNLNEQKLIEEFYERIQKIDREITRTLYEFIQQVQEEYKQRQRLLIESFSKKNNATQQMIYSVEYAKIMGVSKEKIIYSVEELDELLKK